MKELEVLELDSENIDDFTDNMPKMGLIFIAFLAPWCGHCKHFKPEWHKIKEHLKHKKNVKGHIVTMDDVSMKKLPAHVKQPRGFPTMSLYKGTKHIEDYSGGRNLPEVMAFIEEHMGSKQSGGSPKTIKNKKHKSRKRKSRKHKSRKRFRSRSKTLIKRKTRSIKMKNKIWGKYGSVWSPKRQHYIRLGSRSSLSVIKNELKRNLEWKKRVRYMARKKGKFADKLKELL